MKRLVEFIPWFHFSQEFLHVLDCLCSRLDFLFQSNKLAMSAYRSIIQYLLLNFLTQFLRYLMVVWTLGLIEDTVVVSFQLGMLLFQFLNFGIDVDETLFNVNGTK